MDGLNLNDSGVSGLYPSTSTAPIKGKQNELLMSVAKRHVDEGNSGLAYKHLFFSLLHRSKLTPDNIKQLWTKRINDLEHYILNKTGKMINNSFINVFIECPGKPDNIPYPTPTLF